MVPPIKSLKLTLPKRPLRCSNEEANPNGIKRRLYSDVVKTGGKTQDENTFSSQQTASEVKSSSTTRAGLTTRDSNSKKHPGLADLDDDDLRVRRKQDRAALKRQADAKKKKAQQALLDIGAKKVAAHEDALLSQMNKNMDSVVRPPPGPITRKAPRMIAPPMEGRLKGANTNVIEEDTMALESDCSRASDDEFVPPSGGDDSSDTESLQTSQFKDDIFTQMDDREPEASKGSRRHRGRHAQPQRGQVRTMIESHRKVGQVDAVAQAPKRKAGDSITSSESRDDITSSESSHVLLRKKRKTLSFSSRSPHADDTIPDTADHEPARPDDEYGGILDDELHERIPPAVRPSQVKVTARITHDAPLHKVEALDPGLAHHARTVAPRKDRGYRILKLSSEQLQLFKKFVTPAFRAIVAVQAYPWDNGDPTLIKGLCYIWGVVFPDVGHDIQSNGNEYAVCLQRICEYRARIARDVMSAVENYLDDVCGTNAPSAIQEHVDYLLEKGKARFMWQKSDSDNFLDFEGLFLAPYIIAGITSHLEMTAGLPEELQVSDYPIGALALATVAAERALQAWLTGTNSYGEDISKKKEEEFSESNWGVSTKAVLPSIARLSEKKWKKILSAATEATLLVPGTPKLTGGATCADDDARALAYESDSD